MGGRRESADRHATTEGFGLSAYPMVSLAGLAGVAALPSYGVILFADAMSDALGIGPAVLSSLAMLVPVAAGVVALPLAAVSRRTRVGVSLMAGAVLVLTLAAVSVSTSVLALLASLTIGGAASASVPALHPSLLVDGYPTERRMRSLTALRFGELGGSAAAMLLAVALVGGLGFTWRAVFLVMALCGLALTAAALRLREPSSAQTETQLGLIDTVRRLLMVPTLRGSLVVYGVLGLLGLPLFAYVLFYLEERWGVGRGPRVLVLAGTVLASMIALLLASRYMERLFHLDPSQLMRTCARIMGLGILCLVLAANSPVLIGVVVLLALALACFAAVKPALDATLLSVVAPVMRPHASGIAGGSLLMAAGFGGFVVLGGIDRRFGPGGAVVVAGLVGTQAVLMLRSMSTTVGPDIARVATEAVEETELRDLEAAGVHLPLLACRHIDFSYGQVQVLFDVDFTVDAGEMVALLGTNGAGKSTLLRVISGLGLPSRGSVRFHGRDITYLAAEARLGIGMNQIPGGRAIFGPLSVVENLRVFGYSHGKAKRAVEKGMETTFEAFPQLASRRSQPASTLSGGEQQMLALAKALILQPRILLIDELSLGLAPKIIGELLDMVRTINAQGTAVVLVEQSVNVALSLVQHAYFMEKGEIRFDGKADELVKRPDLLRSVFLQGAARGLA